MVKNESYVADSAENVFRVDFDAKHLHDEVKAAMAKIEAIVSKCEKAEGRLHFVYHYNNMKPVERKTR